MTQSEIQAIIDRGGFLYRRFEGLGGTLLFKPKAITDIVVHGVNVYLMYDIEGASYLHDKEDYWVIINHNFREATPEEVEKYVPKKYRKNIVVHETTGVASGGNTTQVITVNSSNGTKSNTNDIFAQKAIAKANSAQANNSMDKASHIKKIREYLLFQEKPITAEQISIGTGLSYHAVNRRLAKMVEAEIIERNGSVEKKKTLSNGRTKTLHYSLYKSI